MPTIRPTDGGDDMIRRLSSTVLLALAVPATVVGCGGDDTVAGITATATTVPTRPNPTRASPPPSELSELTPPSRSNGEPQPGGRVTGDASAEIVDEIVRRVGDETGLDAGAISVDVAIAKVWTDGSLGCAEPGFVYTQRQEAGYQIELSADGRAWSYRVRETGEVVTCDE